MALWGRGRVSAVVVVMAAFRRRRGLGTTETRVCAKSQHVYGCCRCFASVESKQNHDLPKGHGRKVRDKITTHYFYPLILYSRPHSFTWT